jgi:putative transposase
MPQRAAAKGEPMSQSLAKILVHLIYSTKHRDPILTPEVRPKLWEYQAGIFQDLESHAIEIGGTADHVHALFEMSKKRDLCDVIEKVKKGSSRWIKTQGAEFRDFHWQGGYGAFSVSPIHAARVRAYIMDQENHHRVMTFQDEFRKFLQDYDVPYDERYVWD